MGRGRGEGEGEVWVREGSVVGGRREKAGGVRVVGGRKGEEREGKRRYIGCGREKGGGEGRQEKLGWGGGGGGKGEEREGRYIGW